MLTWFLKTQAANVYSYCQDTVSVGGNGPSVNVNVNVNQNINIPFPLASYSNELIHQAYRIALSVQAEGSHGLTTTKRQLQLKMWYDASSVTLSGSICL